ncbi:MAG: type II secretion system secretin GspD [Thiotrichaceae bacterium]|nr:type II secretion system secretin GspD [Thiotrichaceae bacterium]
MAVSKRLSLALLCSSVVVACAPPAAKKPPMSAAEMALGEVQKHSTATTQANTAAPKTPVVKPRSLPLKQVNRVGSLPNMASSSERPPAEFSVKSDTPLELNFEQVDLRQLIETIADALGLSVVIDPAIGDKVTLRTPPDKPLKREDLWPLLQLLLTDTGVSMEKKGAVYHFKKSGPSLPANIGMSGSLRTLNASDVMQITPLRYISVEAALTVLKPLIEPQGRILSLSNLNLIGVIASPDRINRVNKLLSVMDSDPFLHRGMRLYRLANSKAAEVQVELDKILKGVAGATPVYQFIALERINAILAIAPPNGSFNEVTTWIDVLDERSEEGGEQVFIYNVKNLEAKKLATTLTDVFKIEDKKAAEEKERRLKNQQQTAQIPSADPNQPPITVPVPGKTPGPGEEGTVSADLKVNIVADEATNSLIIRAKPRDYRQLLGTIHGLDQVPKEVMINVVIAEVSLDKSSQFGINWRALFGSTSNGSYVGTNFKIPNASVISPGSSSSSSSSTTNTPPGGTTTTSTATTSSGISSLSGLVINQVGGRLTAILNTLAAESEVSLLSRPSILVRNNEEATINVGTSEPMITQLNSSTVTSQISNSVQYKDTGITLKVTPRINDEGIVNLKIYQEVSSLGGKRTTQDLQSFNQRKVQTAVVVKNGDAIVIGGLIETRGSDSTQGLPGLKDIPIIGRTLFGTTDKSNSRTELVLIMVPEIINPKADNTGMLNRFKRRMSAITALLNDHDIMLNNYLDHDEEPQQPSPVPNLRQPEVVVPREENPVEIEIEVTPKES